MGEIKEGQKVKLTIWTVANSEKEFDCSILDIQKDRLTLHFPEDLLNYTEYFEEGEELSVKIFTPTGIKSFDAVILNSPLESEFVIEFVEDYTEIQRREYLRVELDAKIIIERKEHTNIVTHTLDIGGGGIRFAWEGTFEPNESVSYLLYLPLQIRSVRAQGIIKKNPHLPKGEHILLFDKIERVERDRIIKQCFEVQSGLYKKIEHIEHIEKI